MGFKSKSILSDKSNQFKSSNNIPFKLGGLMFDCEEDYIFLKKIDENILHKVDLVNKGTIDFNDSFFNIKSINVIETYPDAADEMDYLFQNVMNLLLDDDVTRFYNEYNIGRWFFSLINVITYDDEA